MTSPKRVVLLIDEVDKADMEFPNDLLHELDRMSFSVAETGEQFTANLITILAEMDGLLAFYRPEAIINGELELAS